MVEAGASRVYGVLVNIDGGAAEEGGGKGGRVTVWTEVTRIELSKKI